MTMLADIVVSIGRLERIVVPHAIDIDIDDMQTRLDELEARRRRKPQ